jgi:hypothetical protein
VECGSLLPLFFLTRMRCGCRCGSCTRTLARRWEEIPHWRVEGVRPALYRAEEPHMERSTAIVVGIIIAGIFAIILFTMRQDVAPHARFVSELDNPMVMRVYDVPPERAQDIRSALSSALSTGNDKTASLGRVTLSGTNQVLVLAPAITQSTIADAVKKLGGDGAVPNVAGATVQLEVWMVNAVSGTGKYDAQLMPIEAALKAARVNLGGVDFRIHDRLTLAAMPNGGMASARSGLRNAVEAHLRPIDQGVQVEIRIGGEGPEQLESTASLKFGEVIVLAQLTGAEDAGAPTRLYVLRATQL